MKISFKKSHRNEEKVNADDLEKAEIEQIVKNNPSLSFLAVGKNPPFKTTEYRLKRQLKRLRIILSLFLVLTIMLLSLYLYEKALSEKRYSEQYTLSVTKIQIILEQCIKDDFDIETEYRELTAEFNLARYSLLYTDAEDSKKQCISDIYYAAVKLPNQVKNNMQQLHDGFAFILDGQENEGYKILENFVSNLDRLDYGNE